MQNQSSHTQHGLKCPECFFLISVSIQDLIMQNPIICPKCGLELNIDTEKSADVIEGLKKIHEAQEEVKRIQDS